MVERFERRAENIERRAESGERRAEGSGSVFSPLAPAADEPVSGLRGVRTSRLRLTLQ